MQSNVLLFSETKSSVWKLVTSLVKNHPGRLIQGACGRVALVKNHPDRLIQGATLAGWLRQASMIEQRNCQKSLSIDFILSISAAGDDL